MPSAKTGTALDANSKNVTTIFLTIVFFMFSPWVVDSTFPRQSIAADRRRKRYKVCIFQSSEGPDCLG